MITFSKFWNFLCDGLKNFMKSFSLSLSWLLNWEKKTRLVFSKSDPALKFYTYFTHLVSYYLAHPSFYIALIVISFSISE